MRDEVISSVGDEDMDTSRYQVSDLDDFEFYWESYQLDEDAAFIPGIDTVFSLTAFRNIEKGYSAENPILLDKEDDIEKSPPTKPVTERPTQPACLAEKSPI